MGNTLQSGRQRLLEGKPGLHWAAPVSVSTGKLLHRPFPWKCNMPVWGAPGDHYLFPEVRAVLLPTAANPLQPGLKPDCPTAARPSHQASAMAPNPHLQPSSSSSWPLPHVWFPLATRQTLGVALSSDDRPPFGPSSFLPPLPGQLPCFGPSNGAAHSTQHPLPQLRGRLRQCSTRAEVWALVFTWAA